MSDLLTHWAVADDCRRIAASDAEMEPLLSEVWAEYETMAHLGAITRWGSKWEPAIFHAAMASKESQTDARWRQKLAFAIGGIAHFPADYLMKPLMSRLARADWGQSHHEMQGGKPGKTSIREISAYYDCHVFRHVYANGNDGAFSQLMFRDNADTPEQVLEAFVRSLFQRTLLSCHTLAPDPADMMGWLDNLIDRVQPLYIDVALYAKIYANPDPEKTAAYAVETEFYRASDPAIALARALQNGEAPAQDTISAAIAEGANTSGYGEAVALGVRTLRGTSAFWRGEQDELPSLAQG